jgi:CRISPR-associated endonuclease/helicase Cas3
MNNQSSKPRIAHVRTSDKAIQSLENHLLEVAEITKKLAAKINVSEAGELIGLMHDFGKYSVNVFPKCVGTVTETRSSI